VGQDLGVSQGSQQLHRVLPVGYHGESQSAIKDFGRPEYEKWLGEFPHTQSLPPQAQDEAVRIWDQQVGAQKTK
jgi:hypothetical protein